MPAPLLVTKLFLPPTRSALTERPELIERLNGGLGRKLTLLSAPAGFGKTTLVSRWLEFLAENPLEGHGPLRAAWLSLDEDDNDPVRFLSYLTAALGQVEDLPEEFGQGAASMLQSPQTPPADGVLTILINDLAAVPGKIVLVLDDLHLVVASPVHRALIFLLDNLPPTLHLVVATRKDPPLSLGRLRAQGHVTELRAADLRFTRDESADFLNRLMELDLTAGEIAELETKTEGWIAGLQLAAISMQGRGDVQGFIRSFSGSNRLVLDFLIEEVLEGQEPEIQEFLLRTSILDRLSGPLCDALTGMDDGLQTLMALYNSNLFIIPLDDENCWYRYHHLFADLIRQRLHQKEPETLPRLHSLARDWYERNGYIEDAIEHAILSLDFEQAADLIETEIDEMWGSEKHPILKRWLNQLPSELVFNRPYLCIYFARLLVTSGRQSEAEEALLSAENVLEITNSQVIQTSGESDLPTVSRNAGQLTGRISATRALMASIRSDAPEIMSHALRALQELPEDDYFWRCSIAMVLGDAYAYQGHYADAVQTYLDAIDAIQKIGNPFLLLYVSGRLAITQKSHGKLQQVLNNLPEQLELADEWGLSQTDLAGWLLAIWGDALAEAGELDRALEKARTGVSLVERSTNVGNLMWSYHYLTRVLFSRGEWAEAEKIIIKTERIAHEAIGPLWVQNSIASWRVRMWLIQGRLELAEHWAQARQFSSDVKPAYVDTIAHLALARILIAQGKNDDARALLDRLLDAAEEGGHITRMIEILLLQATAFALEDQMDRALNAMERALTLGKPDGYVQIFVDEGSALASLLYQALERGIMPEYVQGLLAFFPDSPPEGEEPLIRHGSRSGLVEPLSEREVEVLELLAQGLTNQDIAERLVLSLHTIKTHTRNIYAKLAVNNRTQAVSKARVLGIISSR